MNALELTENLASHMSKVDDSILITFPLFTPRYTKGQIGLQLRGLLKPDTWLSIRFITGPNILAIKLDWTFNGAILYFQVRKDRLIHVGQRIGTIHWQPFQQPGRLQPSSHFIRFHT